MSERVSSCPEASDSTLLLQPSLTEGQRHNKAPEVFFFQHILNRGLSILEICPGILTLCDVIKRLQSCFFAEGFETEG